MPGRRTARILCLLALLASPLQAQYFGQNRVQHRHLDFSIIETEHFLVYYYEGERAAAVEGARMAERAYARLSRLLNHRYRERQPLILFASHSEFQQNNVTAIGEGTAGVTEPLRHRVLLPFTGSFAEFEHVLQHELVHQFQFDVFASGYVGAAFQRLVAVNPPLWFMEGMAEYLSLGPIDPQTAMWLRDAVLEDDLPTIEQMTRDLRYTPYRFGHALWSYVGERWGDGFIGEILQAAAISGVPAAFARTLGVTMEELSDDWRVAVQATYLPQITRFQHAREIAEPVLSRARASGTVHLSPALSPDGSQVAYLSEGNSYWIDLYVADVETGAHRRRLIKSAFSADFESLRFINSAGAWSPDGRFFAFAAKHGGRDDLVIFDMQRKRVHRRIAVPLNGITTPTWSPDGNVLAFTGYDGGWSDLFTVRADGSDLRRLTRDPFADLHPAWSPDGTTISFATDRGAETDFARLDFAPLQIALYRLDDGTIQVLDDMAGRNTNPQWSPDGTSLAFVSDRTGISNVFLRELEGGETYQLTNVITGVTGITPLSPAISWARTADRLVFSYYEGGDFNVYRIDDPGRLKGAPYDATTAGVQIALVPEGRGYGAAVTREETPPDGQTHFPLAPARDVARPSTSPESAPMPSNRRDDPRPGDGSGARPRAAPPTLSSIRRLLDSAALELPDSAEFTYRDYSARLSVDYAIQPTVGYVRDNFGGGVFGGTAVFLSDMLGNHRVVAAGQINGRIDEAQVFGAYGNLSRRTAWTVGFSQDPIFYYTGSAFGSDALGNSTYTTSLDRYVIRRAFLEAQHPFNRFRRVELALRAVNVTKAAVDIVQIYDPHSGYILDIDRVDRTLGGANYVQPSVALVFDNSASLWVGPFRGRRSRLEYAPAFGDWTFHQLLADYRRYDHLVGPFTFASRLLLIGRFGRDSDEFPLFLGTPELLRGYTAGSFRRHECLTDGNGSVTGCGALDQLIGSRLAAINTELRFPLLRNVGAGIAAWRLPPTEAALFFDAGVAWNHTSTLVWRRSPEQERDQERYRTPLLSWGLSLRSNVLGFVILRADWAKPLTRANQPGYWTLSVGPTF